MNLEERIEQYDKITNEFTKNEDAITNKILSSSPEEVIRDSKKFMSLCDVFEIDAGEMEENMLKEKEKTLKAITPEHYKEEIEVTSIIETDDLMFDFTLIRKNLRNNIQSTSTLLEKFGEDLGSSHAEDVSGQMLLGYSELIKSVNTSMKLLIDSYSSVAKTQTEIKKLISLNKDLDEKNSEADETSSVTNIVNFVGTPAEMLANLKGAK